MSTTWIVVPHILLCSRSIPKNITPFGYAVCITGIAGIRGKAGIWGKAGIKGKAGKTGIVGTMRIRRPAIYREGLTAELKSARSASTVGSYGRRNVGNKGFETRSRKGGEKRGNKTVKNLRYRINSIPSGIKKELDWVQ